MKTNKPIIKKCKPFGNSGHIVLSKKDVGFNYMIFPQNQGVVFKDIFDKYVHRIEKLSNPFLTDILTQKEFKEIVELYKKLIETKKSQKGLFVQTHLNVIEERAKELKTYSIQIIPEIILDLNTLISKKLYHKLVKIIETRF